MLLKGRHAIEEALAADAAMTRIIVQDDKRHDGKLRIILDEATRRRIPIDTLSAMDFGKTYSGAHNQGIVAEGEFGKFHPIESLINAPDKHPRLVILDHIEDPFNFGGILRSAEAMGISAVVFPKDRNSTLSPGMIQAASGAIHHIPLVRVTNIAQTIKQLKKAGYWMYGADSNNGVSISDVRVNTPYAIVMGNEAKGLSSLVQKQLDEAVIIPLQGKLSSLNVSVATGIMVYEFTRREG
ncbi:MAG: 23S rRNA (guanosine(2251)-2'-O)-methyltransferase RlmB [bacterium]|nr:23S rRNA (guanosine(2251)-2'-O)-methyltransferase RlmB [bacterium]